MYQYLKKYRLHLILIANLLLILQCRNDQIGASLRIKGGIDLVFLDKKAGGELITTDTLEGYFDKVSLIDISIQMKKRFSENISRNQVLSEYKSALQADVLAFNEEETVFIKDVFKEIASFYGKYQGNLLPAEIKLIKVKGDLFGEDVFYTRQNAIIIPAAKLDLADKTSFTTTMIHELFHIISRLNPDRKEKMYHIFGFEKMECHELTIPDSLNIRLLLNPDGISKDWGIRLSENKDTFLAIPFIYANSPVYDAHRPTFMSYLEFNLFEVLQKEDGNCMIKTKGSTASGLDVYSLPDFFEKTGRNTNYIIHPDEILADNFALIYTTQKDPAKLKKLTPKGKQLLALLEKAL